jgi:hypothetical protein
MRKWLKKLPSFVIPRRKNLLISSCPKLISRNRPFRVPLYEQQSWKEGGLSLWKGSLTKKMLSGAKRFEGSEMD